MSNKSNKIVIFLAVIFLGFLNQTIFAGGEVELFNYTDYPIQISLDLENLTSGKVWKQSLLDEKPGPGQKATASWSNYAASHKTPDKNDGSLTIANTDPFKFKIGTLDENFNRTIDGKNIKFSINITITKKIDKTFFFNLGVYGHYYNYKIVVTQEDPKPTKFDTEEILKP